MALVTRFEDLRAWQEARRLARLVNQATCEGPFARDRSLPDQIRRSATSTVTKIAEGFGSGSNAEFRRVLRYAIRSAAEVQSCRYIAVDQRYVVAHRFHEVYDSAERVKSLCSALVRRLGTTRRLDPDSSDRIAEPSAVWHTNNGPTEMGQPSLLGVTPAHVSTSARQHVSTALEPGR